MTAAGCILYTIYRVCMFSGLSKLGYYSSASLTPGLRACIEISDNPFRREGIHKGPAARGEPATQALQRTE